MVALKPEIFVTNLFSVSPICSESCLYRKHNVLPHTKIRTPKLVLFRAIQSMNVTRKTSPWSIVVVRKLLNLFLIWDPPMPTEVFLPALLREKWLKKKKEVKRSHYRAGQAQRVRRKLRFPDVVTTAQDGGRLSSLRTGRLYPQEILLVLISVRDWVDPRAIVRSEGFYVNEKFTDTSWDRTSDLPICSTAP